LGLGGNFVQNIDSKGVICAGGYARVA